MSPVKPVALTDRDVYELGSLPHTWNVWMCQQVDDG